MPEVKNTEIPFPEEQCVPSLRNFAEKPAN